MAVVKDVSILCDICNCTRSSTGSSTVKHAVGYALKRGWKKRGKLYTCPACVESNYSEELAIGDNVMIVDNRSHNKGMKALVIDFIESADRPWQCRLSDQRVLYYTWRDIKKLK